MEVRPGRIEIVTKKRKFRVKVAKTHLFCATTNERFEKQLSNLELTPSHLSFGHLHGDISSRNVLNKLNYNSSGFQLIQIIILRIVSEFVYRKLRIVIKKVLVLLSIILPSKRVECKNIVRLL